MSKKLHNRASALPTLLWLMLLALLPAQLSARDFEYTYEGQTLKYTVLDEEAKTVKTKEGYMDKFADIHPGNSVSGDLIIPSKVYDGDNEYTVTALGSYAFSNCTDLTNIDIPNSVTVIGNRAFEKCFSLKSVIIPNSVTKIGYGTFQNCGGLESVIIPNSVTEIGEYAFKDCSSLTSVIIPNSVTSINYSAFWECSRLVKAAYPSTSNNPFTKLSYCVAVEYPANGTVEDGFIWSEDKTDLYFVPFDIKGEFEIPNSVDSIGANAFSVCRDMTRVTIPNSVTSIGEGAFRRCSGLTSIDIPESVTSISSNLFSGCSGLTSIDIHNSVTSIGESAFESCSGLTSVIIPNSVTSVGRDAFWGCSGLVKSAYPSNLRNPFGDGIAVEYPAEGEYSYEDGYVWTADKTGLYYVPLDIEGEFNIPNSVTTIGNNAFAGCDGITSLNVESSEPANIENDSFSNYSIDVTVPAGSLADYLSSDWNKFTNLKDASGVVATSFTDEVFNYRVSGTNEAMLMPGHYKSMTTVSIPERVVVDDRFVYVTAIANSFTGCTEMTSLVLPKRLATINTDAFKGCTGLTSLNLPESLATIGNSAFEGCTGLTALNLPASLTEMGTGAFKGCTGLASVEFPASLTEISDEAFEECSALTALYIPESLSAIGNEAFKSCIALTEVTIKGDVKSISANAFESCSALTEVTIKGDVKSIGDRAFASCGKLETFSHKRIGTVGAGAFRDCSKLDNITVDWAEIADETFYNCDGLKSLTLTNDITAIGERAFNDCDGLVLVSIPASVDSIGIRAFYSCNNMKSFRIEDGSTTLEIGESALYGTPIRDMYIGRDYTYQGNGSISTGITSLTYGNEVTSIPDKAFKEASRLAAISFGTSIETIGENAFNGCALTELVMPPHVKTVGNNAFAGNNIKNIAIGSEITEIGEKAFDGANELAGVSITALTPPMANNNTFSYYDCPLYVSPSKNNEVKDAYYNFTRCWYRFTGYDLIPIETIEVEGKAVVALNPGETYKCTVNFTPANASLPYIFWRSTNPEFATVDSEGNVALVDNGGESAQADGEVVTECKIIAETLYADGPVAEFTVQDYASAIDDIVVDTPDAPERPNDIYNLQGICLKRNASQEDVDALAPGLYIIGGRKVLVK